MRTASSDSRRIGRQYTLRANGDRPPAGRLAASRHCFIVTRGGSSCSLLPRRPRAHEIPNDVTVHAFLRPEGQRLRLLVRAPIAAMRDILFPTRDENNLDLTRAEPAVRDAATFWIADSITLYEGGTRLGAPRIVATQISLPSDRSFASYDTALAHVDRTAARTGHGARLEPGPDGRPLRVHDRVGSIGRSRSTPRSRRLGIRVVTTLRFRSPDGVERAFELAGDPGTGQAGSALAPGGAGASSSWASSTFSTAPIIFCSCSAWSSRSAACGRSCSWSRPSPSRTRSRSSPRHSISRPTRCGSRRSSKRRSPRRSSTWRSRTSSGSEYLRQSRWIIALAFGLVHGFGFSFALRQTLQFAGSHVADVARSRSTSGSSSARSWFCIVLVPALQLMFRYVVAERMGTILLSAIVAHTAWHWMIDRGAISRDSIGRR